MMFHEITPLRAPSLEIQAFNDPMPEYLPVVLELALTNAQKEAIRKRDHYTCQFPHKEGEECYGRLEIHHLLPQSYCKLLGIDPDFETNLLTICQNSHQNIIHKDIGEARKHYKPKGDSFLKVQESRRDSLQSGVPYWNTEYDRAMLAIAIKNTQIAESKGWRFPGIKRENLDIITGEIYKYKD